MLAKIKAYIAAALGALAVYLGWRRHQRKQGAKQERTRAREAVSKQKETRTRVENENRSAGADARRDRLRKQARD